MEGKSMALLRNSLLALLVACGRHPAQVMDAELAPMYDGFIQEAQSRNIRLNTNNLVVEYVDSFSDEARIGECDVQGSHRTVKILKDYYEWISFNKQLMLMYHELGHCLCKLDHDDTHLNIMQPNIPLESSYTYSMVDELFDKCKESLAR
jgi:hypothetical protein